MPTIIWSIPACLNPLQFFRSYIEKELDGSTCLEKRICESFPAYGGWRTVPGIDSNIIPKWKNLIDDALDELMVVSSGEVCSSD